MENILARLRNEPALIAGVVLAVASVVGREVTDAEVSALHQAVEVLGPLVAAVILRHFVTPEVKAQEREEAAATQAYMHVEASNDFPYEVPSSEDYDQAESSFREEG